MAMAASFEGPRPTERHSGASVKKILKKLAKYLYYFPQVIRAIHVDSEVFKVKKCPCNYIFFASKKGKNRETTLMVFQVAVFGLELLLS